MSFRRICAATLILGIALSAAAIAADNTAPPKIATPPVTAQPAEGTVVSLTYSEAVLAGIAVANAGSACDLGLASYCQVLQLRSSLENKLQAAVKVGQPAASAKAPAK